MSALTVGRWSDWMIIVMIVEYFSGNLSKISETMTSSLSWSRAKRLLRAASSATWSGPMTASRTTTP
eukprot:3624771-Prymnesium_polylepis.1